MKYIKLDEAAKEIKILEAIKNSIDSRDALALQVDTKTFKVFVDQPDTDPMKRGTQFYLSLHNR